jgi:hypothetical protein
MKSRQTQALKFDYCVITQLLKIIVPQLFHLWNGDDIQWILVKNLFITVQKGHARTHTYTHKDRHIYLDHRKVDNTLVRLASVLVHT